MRKIIALWLVCLTGPVLAAGGGGVQLQPAHNDLSDKASLQRGAKLFVNYCLSCHSAAYMRYQRMGDDLGLSKEQVEENLMFAAEKIGETMQVAMNPEDAEQFFGITPPDLSVIARARGTDWLYTYLMNFYLDDSRPWGVNNLLFRDMSMPHVMWDIQGWQVPVYETVKDKEGHEHEVIVGLELQGAENMSAEELRLKKAEYRRAVRDLVNYLEYMGEPAKLQRISLGFNVIAFLLVLFALTYLLKVELWRDVR